MASFNKTTFKKCEKKAARNMFYNMFSPFGVLFARQGACHTALAGWGLAVATPLLSPFFPGSVSWVRRDTYLGGVEIRILEVSRYVSWRCRETYLGGVEKRISEVSRNVSRKGQETFLGKSVFMSLISIRINAPVPRKAGWQRFSCRRGHSWGWMRRRGGR